MPGRTGDLRREGSVSYALFVSPWCAVTNEGGTIMEQRRRQLSELNLIDNFLFIKLLEHEVFGPRTAGIILSTIIGRDVHVSKVHVEKVFPSEDTRIHG